MALTDGMASLFLCYFFPSAIHDHAKVGEHVFFFLAWSLTIFMTITAASPRDTSPASMLREYWKRIADDYRYQKGRALRDEEYTAGDLM